MGPVVTTREGSDKNVVFRAEYTGGSGKPMINSPRAKFKFQRHYWRGLKFARSANRGLRVVETDFYAHPALTIGCSVHVSALIYIRFLCLSLRY